MENWEGYCENHWRIYTAVSDMLHDYYGLSGPDTFISKCVERVRQDADEDWNEDDVRIAIQNALNELIEKG